VSRGLCASETILLEAESDFGDDEMVFCVTHGLASLRAEVQARAESTALRTELVVESGNHDLFGGVVAGAVKKNLLPASHHTSFAKIVARDVPDTFRSNLAPVSIGSAHELLQLLEAAAASF
jgi:hypothetical protein